MFPILDARWLASDVKWLRIEAPLVARHRQPGQFVIVRCDDDSERIPLTIADSDAGLGHIELIVKAVGKSTIELCRRGAGDSIRDVMGPLGKPTEISRFGRAVVVGGGVGTAVIYPLARALRDAGNHVIAISGGRTRELVMLEAELRGVCQELLICTDDGSYGSRGTVADRLSQLIADGAKIDVVYAAGPVPMMRAVVAITKQANIHTIVSLNPIMVDGTGMCGGCRVTVGGKMRFACVDGPEFDGRQVDFDELADRLTAYRDQEKESLRRMEAECQTATPVKTQ
ncbi:MAG: sulfide/dihydroorotate dehydrogenase-like FAD/NAD-binding protein [Phycisphaerae bacterium]